MWNISEIIKKSHENNCIDWEEIGFFDITVLNQLKKLVKEHTTELAEFHNKEFMDCFRDLCLNRILTYYEYNAEHDPDYPKFIVAIVETIYEILTTNNLVKSNVDWETV